MSPSSKENGMPITRTVTKSAASIWQASSSVRRFQMKTRLCWHVFVGRRLSGSVLLSLLAVSQLEAASSFAKESGVRKCAPRFSQVNCSRQLVHPKMDLERHNRLEDPQTAISPEVKEHLTTRSSIQA